MAWGCTVAWANSMQNRRFAAFATLLCTQASFAPLNMLTAPLAACQGAALALHLSLGGLAAVAPPPRPTHSGLSVGRRRAAGAGTGGPACLCVMQQLRLIHILQHSQRVGFVDVHGGSALQRAASGWGWSKGGHVQLGYERGGLSGVGNQHAGRHALACAAAFRSIPHTRCICAFP